jgi:transcriptional repressor NrdR
VFCPSCNSPTHVLESRRAEEGAAMRRRRECRRCGRRFTTFERREAEPIKVRKRGGERQRFDRVKLRAALLRAAHKRPVSPAQVERIVDRIEAEAKDGELEADRIGELCLEGLRELDLGAYLQFAAVYRQLADPEAIREELRRLGSVRPRRKDSGLPAKTSKVQG